LDVAGWRESRGRAAMHGDRPPFPRAGPFVTRPEERDLLPVSMPAQRKHVATLARCPGPAEMIKESVIRPAAPGPAHERLRIEDSGWSEP
jgi:hypothetical protein